jgi:hypothetical protein
MTSSAKFFLICAVLAAVFGGGGLLYSRLLGAKLSQAVAACQTVRNTKGRQARSQSYPYDQFDEIPAWASDFFVCTPSDLAQRAGDQPAKPDVQGRVVAAYRAKTFFDRSTAMRLYLLSLALCVIGVIPFIWERLLRCLRPGSFPDRHG